MLFRVTERRFFETYRTVLLSILSEMLPMNKYILKFGLNAGFKFENAILSPYKVQCQVDKTKASSLHSCILDQNGGFSNHLKLCIGNNSSG